MPMIDADWSVDRATGNIRYIGDAHGGASPSYATVIQFHRWLQDKADNATEIDNDQISIISSNPSARSTDNYVTLLGDFNIDDTASQHLYDGSIVQGTGGTEVIYDGIVNFGNAGIQIMIMQNGSLLGNSSAWWNTNGGLNPDATQGISHRFMLKVRDAGADIDGRRLIGMSRTLNDTDQLAFTEFVIGGGTSRGNNVLALVAGNDLNVKNTATTIAGWDYFENVTEGYNEQDIDLNSTNEAYWSEWSFSKAAGTTPALPTINNLYEYAKYITRDGSATTLYGLNGQIFRGITHQITYTTLAGGNFADSQSVTFGNGATAQVLADDGTDTLWIQLLTGVAPSTSDSITQGGVTASVNVVTSKTLNFPFIGTSTGSAIIGAYGVGFKSADLKATDQIFQLDNNGEQISVPNNVSFSVTGLVAGEDRVLVAPYDGVATDASGNPEADFNQFTLNTTLNTLDVASVVVGAAIPTDTPATGTIRVQDDLGYYRRLKYSSYSGNTFTIDTTYHGSLDANNPTNQTDNDFNGTPATSGNNVFISYLDDLASGASMSFTSVYLADRDLLVKVRDGGGSPIKEFIQTGAIKSTNQSIAAIRTTDL